MSQGGQIVLIRLTWTALFDLLGGNPQNSKYFDYDFDNRLCHCCARRYFRIRLEPPEKAFDALKELSKCILVGVDILSRLTDTSVTMACTNGSRR